MTERTATWRRDRLAGSHLYLCTDRRVGQGDLSGFLEAVLVGGVDIVQLRDKEGSPSELLEAAAVFRAAADHHDALFIVNDDPALAVEAEADGVHIGQDDGSSAAAREVVGPDRLIGRSTHASAEVDAALGEDCDYFAVGPVHATPTKQGRAPIGLDPLRHAAEVAGDRPWFVTGGMAADTAPQVLATGARRLVVVRALTEADDPAAAAAALRSVLASGPPEPSSS